jgi:CRP-like cAMP-binding protein
MTRPIEEDIVAYIDGELAEAERAAFEARMAKEPALADEVRRQRDLVERLRSAYPDGEDKAFDAQALAALGLGDTTVVELSAARTKRRGRVMPRPWWAGAIAASLVCGILIGRAIPQRPAQQDIVVDRQGQLVAAASLDRALTRQDDGGAGAIKVGMTFRTANGYCRTFRLADGNAGMGCRLADRWSILALVKGRAEEPRSADFRLAGDEFPPSLMSEVDARIVGSPLTPTDVEKARRAQWR